MLDSYNKGFKLIDAPVSGGPSRANIGDLAIMASGETPALEHACAVLQAMSQRAGHPANLHFIRELYHAKVGRLSWAAGGVGSGSKVKAVNQLLAGVHLVAAAEALAFAVKKKMSLDAVYEVVSKGAAYSYVMVDRESATI